MVSGRRAAHAACVVFFLVLDLFAAGGSALVEVNAEREAKMVPLVVNTWPFINATRKAWKSVNEDKKSAIDSVVDGCSTCEAEQCDGTVGYGGSPDENGETTLDAMIMDGSSMNVGAVGALRRVKDAIAVARAVLLHTEHTFLVGDQATKFAQTMGFKTENLTTAHSALLHEVWKRRNCQPNNWIDTVPDPKTSCGPYEPATTSEGVKTNQKDVHSQNHDTIGMLVIDNNGDIAAGTSTNGLRNKIAGRVGDSPIAGSGAYADSKVGAACATGDGDIMMRFLPSFLAVEEMRRGESPVAAAETAVRRVVAHYPHTMGAVVAANREGEFGAACSGMKNFTFCVSNQVLGGPKLVTIPCMQQETPNPNRKKP